VNRDPCSPTRRACPSEAECPFDGIGCRTRLRALGAKRRPSGDDWANWFEAEARLRGDSHQRATGALRAKNLPRLFDDDPTGDEGYRACRDHMTKADVRVALEAAWTRVWHLCPEGPEQFVRQLRRDFQARAWELFLTTVLVDAGLMLEPTRGTGPDIRVRLNSGKTCWIEATTPTPGTGDNAVFQRPTGPWAGALYKEDWLLLRYRSALEEKLKKFAGYRAAGIVGAEDVCLIAISQGAILDSDLHDHETPAIARAVFPIGETVLKIVPYSEQPPTVSLRQACVSG
jgi:hypothetical protein